MFTDQSMYFKDARDSVEITRNIVSLDRFDAFASIKVIARIALTLPVTSVPAERGFSQMQLIKSVQRSCLKEETLNHLTNVRINGEELLTSEEAEKIANIWLSKRHRSSFGIAPESDADETENRDNFETDDIMDEDLEFEK
jgi:hypothetical protein